MNSNLDPLEHIQLGKALRSLCDENILFIGSGLSFHNLGQFLAPSSIEAEEYNQAFEGWLKNLLSNEELHEKDQEVQLINWDAAPGAPFCHPREKYLLPLHVCYGLAGTHSRKSYHFKIFDKSVSCFVWG